MLLLPAVSWLLVRVQLWVCGTLVIVTFLWYLNQPGRFSMKVCRGCVYTNIRDSGWHLSRHVYRQLLTSNLLSRGQLSSAELIGCQPGDVPKRFMQYGYRTSLDTFCSLSVDLGRGESALQYAKSLVNFTVHPEDDPRSVCGTLLMRRGVLQRFPSCLWCSQKEDFLQFVVKDKPAE